MKTVKFKYPIEPPRTDDPTRHVIADRVERHDDHVAIFIGSGEPWRVSRTRVQSIRESGVYFD